ncbi:MAG TPA: ATP-binding protein, partial [Candidatus Eisenbacteria bacterium]|nr:ATP-binding protein [Candidatus Eisenbacteria bacterium]
VEAAMVPPASPPTLGEPAADETSNALRLVARREHELFALAELSQELTISMDLYGVADLVLFNLMGQLGTSRAALWLISEQSRGAPVLLRSQGIDRRTAAALGTACSEWLLERFLHEPRIVMASEMTEDAARAASLLARRESIALFAPIFSRREVLGFIAIGPRVGSGAYGPVELQVLQTSLGMVGVALQNTKLYNRLLENNRQLRLANENLMELDRMKSEFLNNVNHELRTPLTVVIASLQIVLEHESPEPQAAEFLNAALAEAQSLKGHLENLLDFSELRRDGVQFQFETGDVVALLRRYYEERLPGVAQGLRELAFRPSPEVPPCRFDRHRLLQIVGGLVDNAVKFTPEGTRIEIAVSPAETDGAPRVRIDVADDGPGISVDHMNALFESFSQVDASPTRRVGGMGLGLAVAKQLAERMDGTLTVTSRAGAGSTFSLTLPAA